MKKRVIHKNTSNIQAFWFVITRFEIFRTDGTLFREMELPSKKQREQSILVILPKNIENNHISKR